MKKIGIYTLNGNDNYGNKLQNLALKKTIEKYNCIVETIWLESKIERTKNFIKNFLYRIFRYNRRISFIRFNNYLNIKYINKISKMNEYDYIFVGSDQVWNTSFESFSETYLLKNVEPKKRISYVASIGINCIDNKYVDIFKEELKKFKYISVREEEAKNILEKDLLLKNINVHVDPTMLLSKEEWSEYIVKPSFHDEKKYVLLYFLGDIDENYKNLIYKFASNNHCEIINILNPKSIYYACGPSEFLYMEKNAYMIFTDSFHSSVFSIIFERPFVVFERKQKGMKEMNSRISTLLSTFGLEDRIYKDNCSIDRHIDYDYKHAIKILESKRKESKKYFDNILGEKQDEKQK